MEVDYIKCCDCVDGMKMLSDGCIDLTVTSPPYGDMREYNGYSLDTESLIRELYRVTKEGGAVVWVMGDQTKNGDESGDSFKTALMFKSIGFKLFDTMIYQKSQACFGSNRGYLQSFEYMFVFSKGRLKTSNLIRDRENVRPGIQSATKSGMRKDGTIPERIMMNAKKYGKRKNVWTYGVGGGKTGHPAVFPYDLARDHIISWSDEGDLVLDPMCGSGTTLLAAKNLGRHYIGMDCSEEYCEMSRIRVENV